MAYYRCVSAGCRIAIFVEASSALAPSSKSCPYCWTTGERLDTGTIDDLLAALEKRIDPEQMRLAFDGPTASQLRQRVIEATGSDEATRFAVVNVEESEVIEDA